MILENKIVDALRFFGAMSRDQIIEKLSLVGLHCEPRDVDHALRLLITNQLVRRTDYDETIFIIK